MKKKYFEPTTETTVLSAYLMGTSDLSGSKILDGNLGGDPLGDG